MLILFANTGLFMAQPLGKDTRFKPGFDARRGKQRVEVIGGMSVAELAQSHSHAAMHLLHCVTANLDTNGEPRTDGKKYPTASRVRSAELILAYAVGKPESMIKLQSAIPQGSAQLVNLSTDQLLTLIQETHEATQDT